MSVVYWLAIVGLSIPVYAYVVYPLLLVLLGMVRRRPVPRPPKTWPTLSITVPAHNEAVSIADTLESLLGLDYPRDRLQILVVSDASTDGTDDIVRSFADRGVELLRVEERVGKTGVENRAMPLITGEIVVNTDASVRIRRDALKPLVTYFSDPGVGLVSGRDVSVAPAGHSANVGETRYVGYEMWVRSLESRVSGIVGASGCFYALRADLHRTLVPEALSRDFAAAMVTREAGFRAVSANDAVCFVPRSSSLRHEFRRKSRTMTRGLETLFFKRRLLNPFRYGLFSWMLLSHKLMRWLVPWGLLLALVSLALLAPSQTWAAILLALGVVGGIVATAGWFWPGRNLPRLVGIPTYFVFGNIAALQAWLRAVRGELNPIWEPTRRDPVKSA